MHHRDWRKLDDTELDAEVAGARQLLEDICGRAINEASIPFGSYRSSRAQGDYDRKVTGAPTPLTVEWSDTTAG